MKVESTKYCSNCGGKLSTTARFCESCGTEIKQQSIPIETKDYQVEASVEIKKMTSTIFT
ncbi:MAG: zinc-ribbon domain-containing protein [Promethearchaeota archaeon]